MLQIFIVLISLTAIFILGWRLLKWSAVKRLQKISNYFHHIVDLSQSQGVVQSIPVSGYLLHDAVAQVASILPNKDILDMAKLYTVQACNC